MIAPRLVLALLLAASGCEELHRAVHGKSQSAAASTDAAPPSPPSSPSPSKPDPPPAAATTATAAAPVPELITNTFFRAPGGTAIFHMPELAQLRDNWTSRFSHDGAVPVLQLAYQHGSKRALIEVRMLAHQDVPQAAKDVASQAASALAAQSQGAKILGGRTLPLPGGDAYGVGVQMPADKGPESTAGIVAITDGGDAVLVVTLANSDLYTTPELDPVLDAVYKHITVGSKVSAADLARTASKDEPPRP